VKGSRNSSMKISWTETRIGTLACWKCELCGARRQLSSADTSDYDGLKATAEPGSGN
jgi:hypothetical protein